MVAVSAQSYKSLFEGNPRWNIAGFGEYLTTQEIYITEHAIVNLNGKVLYDLLVPLWEDSTHSRLYMVSYQNDSILREKLIMDLTLTKDDTFHFYIPIENGIPQDQMYAVVDTVYYMEDRKVIEFKYEIEAYNRRIVKLKFIEGIGPNVGFTYQGRLFMFNKPILLCYKNENYEWMSEITDTCYVADVGIISLFDINTNMRVSIYPNPVVQKRFIVKGAMGAIMELVDFSGRIVMSRKIESHETECYIGTLRPGLYLVNLYFLDKILTSKILISK